MLKKLVSVLINNIIIVSFGIIFVLFSFFVPYFLTFSNIVDGIIGDSTEVVIASLGLLFILRSGEFDLSIGGMATLASMSSALLQQAGYSTVVTVLLVLGLSPLVGLINGMLVVMLNLSSWIATLGMAFVLIGSMMFSTTGKAVFGVMSPSFLFIAQGYLGFIRFIVIIVVIVYFLAHFIISRTRVGRIISLIGGNALAVTFAGIKTKLYITYAFIFCSVFCAFAGIVRASRIGSGQNWTGWTLVLDAYTAIFISIGISEKGEPFALGALMGALMITMLTNGLSVVNINYFTQLIVKGLLLIGVISIISLKKARTP